MHAEGKRFKTRCRVKNIPFIYKIKMGMLHGKYNEEAEMAELVPRSKLARRLFNCRINLLPESRSHRNREKGWLNDVGVDALNFR
jgi:hypothetical protein